MFIRNLLIIERNGPSFFSQLLQKQFCTTAVNNKTFIDSKLQGKVFNKLYGKRMVGQKKRVIPLQDSTALHKNGKYFNEININGKSLEQNRCNFRRISMLNKLFMQHITGLLALGIVSDKLLNKSLQITHVRVSIDYTHINVYWICPENSLEIAELEKELQRCSGLIRHELSQLDIMGSIPRINFISDRMKKNYIIVDETLKNLQPLYNEFNSETVLNSCSITTKVDLPERHFTEMSQDIFDLNHGKILLKIINKMKISKQAWQLYNKDLNEKQKLCEK